MRALAASLLLLLPSLLLAARVFNDPLELRALARQSAHNGVPKVPPQFNINSGGPETGRFVADAPEWVLGNTAAFVDDDAIIGGAEDKNLPMYKSHRFGLDGANWGYNIPVMEPGIYGCTAHFAELHFDAFMTGKRVFNLHFATANGDIRNFESIDVFDELGGAEFTVLTKTAVDLVVTGILAIRLQAIAGDAMLSGLTCERTGDLPSGVEPDFETDPRVPTAPVTDTDTDGTDTMQEGVPVSGTEININCGGEAVGRFSAEDYSWIRGKTSQWEGPPGVEIGGAEEKNRPAVKSHRYGQDGSDWGYVIPLENPGIYDCSLHFSETDSESFKVGARVFDIMIMDQMLEDVDIYRDAAMAQFTAVVKTFTDLAIPSQLTIHLKAKVGNAYVSAITCEKTGSIMMPDGPDVKESPGEEDMTEEPSPPAIDPSLAPSPAPPMESPMPTPGLQFPVTETPVTEPSEPVLEPTPFASVTSTVEDPEVSTPPALQSPTVTDPQVTPSPATESPESEATIDDPLEQLDGNFVQQYELEATVNNGIFTELVKDALLIVSTDAITVPSTFAMTKLERREPNLGIGRHLMRFVSRQEEDATNIYVVTLQGRHEVRDPTETTIQYTEFINDDANNRLKERGVDNVTVRFMNSRTISQALVESNTSNTSLIVGVTVGCVLAALVVVALIAFFVVNRKRNNEPSAAGFDAPPPPMTESEMSSVRERSETGASVEYLDDDSTFTAATSRNGDHVDQVGFVKDVFGRGTADGAHGSS